MLLASVAVTSTFAQSATIGDKAPAFKHDGVAKGKSVDPSKGGRVTVVEFWATWCGPCIAAMPHMSDIAEKFAKDVDFVSVNAYDYKGRGTANQVTTEEHKPRILEFIKANDQKMRYNIVFDTATGDIAKSWMDAYAQRGIPCAYIVDREGRVAWVGHPMSMDEPLKQVVEGKFDLAASKATFEKQAAKERAQAKMQGDITAAVKAKSLSDVLKAATIDGALDRNGFQMSVAMAARTDAGFAASIIESQVGKLKTLEPYIWSSLASTVTTNTKDAELRSKMKTLSENAANSATDEQAALSYTYHARMLLSIDDKAGALQWAERASGKLEFQPEARRGALKQFIDQTIKMANQG